MGNTQRSFIISVAAGAWINANLPSLQSQLPKPKNVASALVRFVISEGGGDFTGELSVYTESLELEPNKKDAQ